MKKLLLLNFLSFAFFGAMAQCPFTAVLSTTGQCPGSVLTVDNGNGLSKIIWEKDGVPVSTVTAALTFVNGFTVAGGNGKGNAANQLNGAQDVCMDASGNIYILDQGNNRVQKW